MYNGAFGSIDVGRAWIASSAGGGMTTRRDKRAALPAHVDLGRGEIEIGAHEPVSLRGSRADERLPEHEGAPDDPVAVTQILLVQELHPR